MARLELSGVLEEVADKGDLAVLEFQQGNAHVFVGLAPAVFALVGPVDGGPVCLNDGAPDFKGKFRVLAEEDVEEFRMRSIPSRGWVLGKKKRAPGWGGPPNFSRSRLLK